jgi:hypothetical protein
VPTDAKKTFDVNIQRATYFLDIHEQTQPGVGAPTNARRELPRGAVVFAVGALDAYLSEVSAEIIVGRLKKAEAPTAYRDVLRQVNRDVPTLPLEVALLPTKDSREQRVRDAITEYFFTKATHHGTAGVAAVLQRLDRKPSDFWSALASQGHANAPARLDNWTNKRHEIVHEGKRPQARRPATRKFVELAEAIVAEIEKYAAAI